MNRLWITLLTLFLLSFSLHAQGENWEESEKVAEIFAKHKITGTFVLYDVTEQKLIGYNRVRAHKRYVPASTFKIANTLIGLSLGAVKDVDEVLPYGGKPQPFPVWEKDMSLREAIVLSNVAIYQELARRIGLHPMATGVVQLGYGNEKIGSLVESFWLVGPLKISAIKQTKFLAKLAQDTLPMPQSAQAMTREILQLEQNESWILYGKTGWENAPGPGIGWWVGWVRKSDKIYAFALNMDIEKAADAKLRVELGKACLEELGILITQRLSTRHQQKLNCPRQSRRLIG